MSERLNAFVVLFFFGWVSEASPDGFGYFFDQSGRQVYGYCFSCNDADYCHHLNIENGVLGYGFCPVSSASDSNTNANTSTSPSYGYGYGLGCGGDSTQYGYGYGYGCGN